MPGRTRDYKSEYAKRKQRAIARGYTGYSQQRKVNRYVNQMVEQVMNRIDTTGFDWQDLDKDDPMYWIWFRVNYPHREGTPA